jgi:asparagine synthase (glutamine-hydrolysing)
LTDAIKSHLIADVPVGFFLSGGIDSSLVSAISARIYGGTPRTFTIGFAGGGDERAFASTVARHIESQHREATAEVDLAGELPRLIGHLDQPLSDNSIFPTFLVSRLAREEMKVVLSGDGGDELFSGYDWTRFALSLPDLNFNLCPFGWSFAYRSGPAGFLQRLCYDLNAGSTMRYMRRVSVSREFRNSLYFPEFLSKLESDPADDLKEVLRRAPVRDKRERFLYADLCRYLPDDVLFKVDRMSMANSLEVRVPLLDHVLVEWLFTLPFSMRFRRGRGKYLLRKVAARYLPPSILKPRKQGFTIPMGRWLRGGLGTTVKSVLSSRKFAERGIIQPQTALALLDMHRNGSHELGHRIWSLFLLEVWMRAWLDGTRTDCGLSEFLQESGGLP